MMITESDRFGRNRGQPGRVSEIEAAACNKVVIMASSNDKPTDDNPRLSPDEILRYSRHLIMPEVAMGGQLRLKAASVLIVGAGGLGAPVGLYLAAAGVGKIGLVDFDVVDRSNLQRQVVFGTKDVGRPKLEAARERLCDLNPEIQVLTHAAKLTRENAREVIGDYDIVVDCTDNFPVRYLVGDACVFLGKPNVYGAVFRFEGQAAVFSVQDGPCYRCLYPEPPPPDLAPSCADAGVLGVLPGIVGAIQANETIKLILRSGRNLGGRLLMCDALEMRFREIKIPKNPDCPVCGPNPTITELVDYEELCETPGQEVTVPELNPVELKEKMDAGNDIAILDVREPHEFEISNLGGLLIPTEEITARMDELDPAREIVVVCRYGIKSAQVVDLLRRSGFDNVWNLRGGIVAWSDDVDPSIPKYCRSLHP